MILLLRLVVGVAVLGLTACSSAPTHYYTLMSSLSSSPSPITADAAPFQFEMLPVRIPVQVDQPELIVRQGNSSLAIMETERWSSPLADEFHDALESQLERQLGVRNLAGLPKKAAFPILTLRTDVRRFESAPGGYALIDVIWSLSLRSADSKRRNLTCSSIIREPAGQEVESLVLAHQRAVSRLAETIAGTANRWARQANITCPSR